MSPTSAFVESWPGITFPLLSLFNIVVAVLLDSIIGFVTVIVVSSVDFPSTFTVFVIVVSFSTSLIVAVIFILLVSSLPSSFTFHVIVVSFNCTVSFSPICVVAKDMSFNPSGISSVIVASPDTFPLFVTFIIYSTLSPSTSFFPFELFVFVAVMLGSS